MPDITALPGIGTPATSGDGIVGYDVSAAEGSRIVEIPFSGVAGELLNGQGGWVSLPIIENDCINGTFDHWQRGISQTSSGYGSDDRWNNSHSGSTKVHSQQLFTNGQTDVPGNPEFYSSTVVSSVVGASNFCQKWTKLLDVRRYSGKKVAFSFYAKADSAKDIALEGVQNFGIGGSTRVDSISVQKVTLSSTWQKYILYIDFPSVTGKTIGALSSSQFTLWFESGSTYDARTGTLGQQSGTFDISEVEIYASDIELPVRRRTAEEELSLCSPFCQWVRGGIMAISSGIDQNLGAAITFPFSMIDTPSCTQIANSSVWKMDAITTSNITGASQVGATFYGTTTDASGDCNFKSDFLLESEL